MVLAYVSHYASQRRQANKIDVVIFNLYQSRTGRTEDRIESGTLRAPRKPIGRMTESNTQSPIPTVNQLHIHFILIAPRRMVLGAMATPYRYLP